MVNEKYEVHVNIKSNHLFRYPSEWDPRQTGKTKGGYLEGSITLPNNLLGFMRMVLCTSPDCCVTKGFDKEILTKIPHIGDAHPTMIHVVRKSAGNRRIGHKEPYLIYSIEHKNS